MILILCIILLLIFVLTKSYIRNRKKLPLIGSIILIVFLLYSILTYDGSVRIGIAITSKDIVSAYTTEIERGVSRGNNYKYFHPKKDIKIISGSMYDLECRNYFIIKVCKYYGV